MSIEIIDKLKQKNNGAFKLVDLDDVDYDGTGKSAKEVLDKCIQKEPNKGLSTNDYTTPEKDKLASLENYDDTSVKNDIQTQKARIDTFTSLKEGSTTGDAELIDGRIGANGIIYSNLGTSIREQLKDLNITYNYQFIDFVNSKTDGKYYYDAKDGENKTIINSTSHPDYAIYTPVKLKAGKYYFVNLSGAFSYIIPDVETAESGEYKKLSQISTIEGSDGGSPGEFEINYDCTFYPCSFKDLKYAMLANEKLPSNYVKGAFNILYNGVDVQGLKDAIDKDVATETIIKYSKVVGEEIPNLFTSFTGFNTDVGANGMSATITASNQGLQTNEFTSNVNNMTLNVNGSFTCTSITIILMYYANNSWVFKGQVSNITGGIINHKITVDSANYAVYNKAEKFKWLIMSEGGTGEITINSIKINNLDEFTSNELYADNLLDLSKNMINEFKYNKSQINRLDYKIPYLCDANGNKYTLAVDTTGSLKAISNIPNKAFVFGNSLVGGMGGNDKGGSFGMCATDSTKDFYTYVKNAIISKNSSAIINKDSIAVFEQKEDKASADTESTRLVGLLDSDTDLVIIEIGDNVNNDIKRTTFNTTFPEFIKKIKTKCQNARILVVGVWFLGIADTNRPEDTMRNTCKKYGCEYVDISYLHTKENEATIGDTITYIDGSIEPVPDIWATHPGNTGMELIARDIISAINM